MEDQQRVPPVAVGSRLWTVEDVAEYLGVPVGTIYHWRVKGYGPLGVRVGRFVRFRGSDVVAWLDAQQAVAV